MPGHVICAELLLDLLQSPSRNTPQTEGAIEPFRATPPDYSGNVYHPNDGAAHQFSGSWPLHAARQVIHTIDFATRVNGDRPGHMPVGPRAILDVFPSMEDGPG